MLRLVGYADRISVAPGGRLKIMVSCYGVERFRAELRRIVQGDVNPDGPGYRDERIELDLGGPFPGRMQPIHAGSYAVIDGSPVLADLAAFTVAAVIAPTTPDKPAQGVVAHRDPETGAGFALTLEGGEGAGLVVADGMGRETRVVAGRPMLRDHWYLVVGTIDAAAGRMRIVQRPLRVYAGLPDAGAGEADLHPNAFVAAPPHRPALIAALPGREAPARAHFNGRIDSPRIYREPIDADEVWRSLSLPKADADDPRLVAAWDFARGIPTQSVEDASPAGLHGRLVNMPARGVAGFRWTGEHMAWTMQPAHYGAIHFHDDDLYDAGWQPDLEVAIPTDLRSGIYAVRLVADDADEAEPGPTDEYYVVFCVRPPKGRVTAKAAFLMPTASYMAYANHRLGLDVPGTEVGMGRLVELSPHHLFLQEHPEFGYSFYEVHNDGSGVFYSSRLRPIVDFQPKVQGWLGGRGSGLWQFNADTHILGWLEQAGYGYDAITDEDLHEEGIEAIRAYRVILTGTHPEYYSAAMLDALQAFVDGGGRLMYLGGNGFYWRISYSPSAPGAIEVRRSEDGIRPWEPGTGNYYHGFTGEYGGLWRRNGRPPNRLVGVGMTSQGFDIASPYHRRAAADDARAAFVFEGIASETIGDFGLSGGGAAGLELDRAEAGLGTPPHALVLASSRRHTDVYLMTPEDMLDPTPDIGGTESELVRADMTFFETPGGGAVFSTGSIAWAGAMAWNAYDNEVARIADNVLRRFLDPAPFLPPSGGEE